MANTYFSQYIDDIDRVITEAIHKHDMASVALKNARIRNEKAQANRDYSVEKKMVEAMALKEAGQDYKKAVTALQEETDAAFKDLRRSLAKHIAEFTVADPGKLDQNSLVLLNSGALSDSDLIALANKHWNNPTMLKVIASHAKSLADNKNGRYLAARIEEYLSPDSRLRAFDDVVGVAMRTIQHNEGAAGVFQKVWREKFYSAAKSGMAKLDSFSMEAV